ncbi:MAG: 16S rRNA (guanine(527)-N(7))-methyltransferase RsmG [Mycoplasmatales bacterium]
MNTKSLEFFYQKYELNEKQKQQYQDYLQLIQEYNKVMNLTGIDDEYGVYLKHYYDSLLIEPYIKKSGLLIGDLGSGAGFPGIVLAIYYPQNVFHLIEPLQKRCKFLQIVVEKLKLQNVQIINKRAEELTLETYDIVTSRAVAKLNILLELAIPLVKTQGTFIALKGANALAEVELSQNALSLLNSKIETIQEETIPDELAKRYNLVIKKEKPTNKKYPRNYGQIKKKPL